MKVRYGFVSNSSSSSFVVARSRLTDGQVRAIERHAEIGKVLGIEYAEYGWNITVTDHEVKGDTSMDNFSMEEFFDCIGVNRAFVTWDHGHW